MSKNFDTYASLINQYAKGIKNIPSIDSQKNSNNDDTKLIDIDIDYHENIDINQNMDQDFKLKEENIFQSDVNICCPNCKQEFTLPEKKVKNMKVQTKVQNKLNHDCETELENKLNHNFDEFIAKLKNDDFVMSIVGKKTCGKTIAIYDILKRIQFEYDNIIWINPGQTIYSNIKKDFGKCFVDKFTKEDFNRLLDWQSQKLMMIHIGKEKPKLKCLLIMSNQYFRNNSMMKNIVDKFSVENRNYKISILIENQISNDISAIVKNNLDYQIVFKQSFMDMQPKKLTKQLIYFDNISKDEIMDLPGYAFLVRQCLGRQNVENNIIYAHESNIDIIR